MNTKPLLLSGGQIAVSEVLSKLLPNVPAITLIIQCLYMDILRLLALLQLTCIRVSTRTLSHRSHCQLHVVFIGNTGVLYR